MRVVFAGTSEFAVPSLEALIASKYDVVAVITQPDKPKGRGREMHESPVKIVAKEHGIPVLQPHKLKDPEAIKNIKEYSPVWALVVAAYGQIVPAELLYWPEVGSINLHGSILPKYRGAAPIQYAIIMGEQETGVTTMLMDEGLDTGDILLQESIPILKNETAGELTVRLARLGADLLIKTLDGLKDGTINPIPQDDELATYAKALAKDSGFIDWTMDANVIVNLIRGVTPKPGAFISLNDNIIKVWRAEVFEGENNVGKPGEIMSLGNDGIIVAAGTGLVKLIELQPQSRKRMPAIDFARGSRIEVGTKFETSIKLEGV